MSASNRTRIAVAGGAALLCAGVSVPAAAHGTQDATKPARTTHVQRLSFAQLKEIALRQLDRESAWLTALKTKVAGDDRLTAAQKSAFTARLDELLAAVASAQSAVQAATIPDEMLAALRSAWMPLAYPRHHAFVPARHHAAVHPQHHAARHVRHHATTQPRRTQQVTLTAVRANDPDAVRAHRSVDVTHHRSVRWQHVDRGGWSGDRRDPSQHHSWHHSRYHSSHWGGHGHFFG